jgi:hypothetical protein
VCVCVCVCEGDMSRFTYPMQGLPILEHPAEEGYMSCLTRSGTSNLGEINCRQTLCTIAYVSSIAIWL